MAKPELLEVANNEEGQFSTQKFRLITRHGWIDELAPSVDATGHALGIRESVLSQPACNLQASHAAVSVNDQAFFGEFRKL